MSRRVPTLDVDPIIDALADDATADPTSTRILDATLELLTTRGLRPWGIDDVVAATGAGRTTIYRRFGDRDHLVAATIARECQTFFETIAATVPHGSTLADQVVEGFLLGLRLARRSSFSSLVDADPDTFLPFLTSNAERLIVAARAVLVRLALSRDADLDTERAALVSEVLTRLAISLLMTPSTLIDIDDEEGARRALHLIVDPLSAAGGSTP